MDRRLAQLAGVLGFTGVALGAFGAHGVKGWLGADPEAALRLSWWETAARYHLMHALAVFAVAVLARHVTGRLPQAAAWSFASGAALFSGSLYAMALSGERGLGRVIPLGGACFLAGWVLVVLAAGRLDAGAAARGSTR